MRPTPGTAYLPLDARLDRGEKLLVIGKAEMEGGEPAWYRVLSPDRTPLWVHRDYLEKVGPVPEDLAEMGRGRVERVQNRMREEEKADSVARRDDALRDRIAKVQSQLKAASGKPEEDLSPLKAELEAVLAEAEFRLTKLEAASVFKDILLLEKQRELAKARAVAEATEEELREAIRLADERYQEALKGLAKLAPVRELGFTAIGWVHYRRGEWVIEKAPCLCTSSGASCSRSATSPARRWACAAGWSGRTRPRPADPPGGGHRDLLGLIGRCGRPRRGHRPDGGASSASGDGPSWPSSCR
jgi:hypothetical protein